MKKQLKLMAAALVLSVTASTSFAVPELPVVDLADSSADLATYHDMAIVEMNLGFGTSSTVENVAYVGQEGDSNIAYVSQTGVGNFAVITQVNTTQANVAYVSQTGDTNRAVINQR
jgi:hypothetical protein